jgi:hypothetical protein
MLRTLNLIFLLPHSATKEKGVLRTLKKMIESASVTILC